MNYLANALPLNGVKTGELSDSYPNLFVPAGITFSIWGIIYLLLAAFCVIQFTGANKSGMATIELLFGISCLLNAMWIVFWHYKNLPSSLIIIVAFLVVLIYINLNIKELPFGLIKAAFGIYLGWLCIATIANVTALLVHYNWTRFGLSEETWTIIMILTGALIASLTLINMRNPFIGLSVLWAFAGIIIKRQSDYRSIVIAASVAILVVGIVTVFGFIRKVSPGLA